MSYQGVPDPGAATCRPRGTRLIEGVEHKICSGPSHDVPTWLPADDKYFYRHKSGSREGKLTSRCRLCTNWYKLSSPGESGYVRIMDVQKFVRELVGRIGKAETARRSQISPQTLWRIMNCDDHTQMIVKRTVRKLMLQVISARRKGEVYHKKDIRGGINNRKRLKPLRPITSQRDLYYPHGDNDNEARRDFRRRTGR
jgi:hypothetical protein